MLIPLPDGSFCHPLTLGVRRPQSAVDGGERSGSGKQPATYEAWREGLGLIGTEYEKHPAERVLEELRRAAVAGQARRPWLVLGEPGAGKSTLLQAWFNDWANGLPGPRLGLPVPVLVRLRELQPGDLDGDPEAIADRLWREHGAPTGAARCAGHPAEAIYRADRGRAVQPVWLFDGLDELDERLRGERLLERLVALPGAKLVTCRTVVFQAMRRDAVEVYKEHEFEVLPLRPVEQEAFLAGVLAAAGRASARAKVRCREIQANAALRPLAGNPLMLRLIAEVPDGRALPVTRSAFYREAVGATWSRKVAPAEATRLRKARDRALTEAARQMGLEEIEAELSCLVGACEVATADAAEALRAALERAGLVWVEPRREVFSFVHLTFQEFYLAHALEPAGLRPALEQHWAEARYEETLALLISHLLAAGRAGEVDAALHWLVDWGAQTHRREPRRLWCTGRSPLRVVLHLLRRAGARWAEVPLTAGRVEAWLRAMPLGRLAVAADIGIPPDLLAILARDANQKVRDAGTPPDLLAALVPDGDTEVRRRVAQNPTTPTETLATLAHDADNRVRYIVAGHPAASAETLATLARDDNLLVRAGIAQNPAAPVDLLATLARDADNGVRRAVAGSPMAPVELLDALACDANKEVRRAVAGNRAVPVKLLAILARDAEGWVRGGIAQNPVAPAELLAILARDADERVRDDVAGNRAVPVELLAILARDSDDWVRRSVAVNPAAPADLLVTLAQDAHRWVRRCVASNSATPADLLAALARDGDRLIRGGVAQNFTTPTELLAALACDAEEEVRYAVANNPVTPTELLAALARDARKKVRRTSAENPNTFLEDLLPQRMLGRMRVSGSIFIYQMGMRFGFRLPGSRRR